MLDRYDQELLLDYLEGELEPDRRAQLDAMLAQDPQLAALLSAMAQDRAALRALPQAQAPADLMQDLTQGLERRMLLDDETVDIGPIPIGRGRELHSETSGGPRWGRIAGLSALAASVALAAGIVVITMGDGFDPLMRTAQKLADDADASASAGSHEESTDSLALKTQPETTVAGVGSPDTARERAIGATATGPTSEDERTNIAREGVSNSAEARTIPPKPEGSLLNNSAAALARATQPQAPIALAVTEPRVQLVLFSEKPELTNEQLIHYCVTNGIPIVQTNLAVNGYDNSLTKSYTQAADPINQNSVGQFALLVDEKKLDELVLGLNNSIALDTQDVSRGAKISNQAAVLTQVRSDQAGQRQFKKPSPNALADSVNAPDPDTNSPADLIEKDHADANAVTQQPIELQLPADLGSDFANSRNRDNLFAEQQRSNYGTIQKTRSRPADLQESPAPLTKQDNEEAAPNAIAQLGAGAAGATEAPGAVEEPLSQPRHRAADDPTNQGAPNEDKHLEENSKDLPVPTVENKPQALPAESPRGNWLSPYLPLASTTQILNWRQTGAQPSPQLVPILIQLAPTEEVNNLRQVQQAEQSRRQGNTVIEHAPEAADTQAVENDAAPDAPAEGAGEATEVK